MRRVVLDADILSEIIKGKDASLLDHVRIYAREHGNFTFTSITAQELVFGLKSKQDYRKLALAHIFFNSHEIIVPNHLDYLRAGEIRGIARRQGRQIALDDCLIGVVAPRLGLPVPTGNTSHFEEMQQAGLALEIENWRLA